MYTQTNGAYSIAELYAKRNNISLSRSECKQHPRRLSVFEWSRVRQAGYINNLLRGVASPPKVFIYAPLNSGKGAVLDGRQRLKAFFSYLDDNFSIGEAPIDSWAGKTYEQLRASSHHLADALMQASCEVSVINATNYWEAAVATYPQICGHSNLPPHLREDVMRTHGMLMRYLANGDPIFDSENFCDQRVLNLKKSTERMHIRIMSPTPPASAYYRHLEAIQWQIRATEFVARHHRRGAIPC